MLAALKNLALTVVFIVAATAITAGCAGVAALIAASGDDLPADFNVAVASCIAIGLMGAMFGALFSVVTLPVAIVTMPPVLGISEFFRLPRPAMDMIGGAMAGLLSAMIAVESLDNYKTQDIVAGAEAQIFAIFGLIGGCLLGYLRHKVLVRPRAEPVAVQIAA
jgi:hypothetical protein